MSFIDRQLKQTAVYWPLGSAGFDRYGRPLLGTPVEVSCRWEEKAEEFIGPQGTRELTKAVVFVSQDVDLGGLLLLDSLDTVEGSSFPDDPKEYSGVWEIRAFGKVPSVRGDKHSRTALLGPQGGLQA